MAKYILKQKIEDSDFNKLRIVEAIKGYFIRDDIMDLFYINQEQAMFFLKKYEKLGIFIKKSKGIGYIYNFNGDIKNV